MTVTVVTVAKAISLTIIQTVAIAEAAEVSATMGLPGSPAYLKAKGLVLWASWDGPSTWYITDAQLLIWNHRSLTQETLIMTTLCGPCLTCIPLLLHGCLRTQPYSTQCLVVAVLVATAMRGN